MSHYTLLLSNTRLIAFHLEKNQLLEHAHFALDDAGKEAFEGYLEVWKEAVFSLLVDVVEEDFQLESIPHLGRSDRNALLARRLDQNYRTTPYRRAFVQSLAKSGGQDKVLMSALTLVAPVDAIVNALLAKKIVLQGIYSAALLAGEMVHKSGLGLEHYLLVSFTSGGGMRQTYLAADGLKFSRVSSLPEDEDLQDAVRLADVIVLEALRARQYLSTLRLLGRDDKLQLAVVAPRGLDCQSAIDEHLAKSGEAAQFVVSNVPLNLLAQKLRLPPADSMLNLLCSWLELHPPVNHYGQARHLIHATWRKRGIALRWGSFACLILAMLWSALLVQEAGDIQASINQSLKRTAQIDERLRYFGHLLKQSKASDPAAMKGAYELYTHELLTWPSVEPPAQQVSQILLDFPELVLDELRWNSGRAPLDPATAQVAEEGASAPVAAPVVLELSGRVEPFDLQYRRALASVERLSQRLSGLPGVQVKALILPLNTSSEVGLEGKLVSPDSKRVDFSLRLSWEQKAP
ncbi:hypothetical protein [Janthinobacterium sp. B9-8]|uniref:hypothetical protein n=1 Tax=Janthinobacterium sp. B9-8 TaxID=1236179 RepID=UPI00061D1E18|nr:hypothetical protein [Janthinobacterium sp. B9-8]AMC36438.1 hypothetical protein VN23_18520 [Janthinobacterium sp. B9-8]